MKGYWWTFVTVLVLSFTLVFTGCGPDDADPAEEEPEEAPDPDRKVEEIVINTTTMDYDPARNEVARWVGDTFETELGVDVEVQPREFTTLVDSARRDPGESEWQAITLGWSGRIERADPDMFTHTLFHSDQAYDGGNNYHNYESDEYDELAEQARMAFDEDERQELVYEMQEKLAEDIPMIVLYNEAEHQAQNVERWDNVIQTPEGKYSEWFPYYAEPLTDDDHFRIGYTQDLDTFNPLAATTVFEWKLLRLNYDKLFRVGPDMELRPWMAEDHEVVDEQTIDVELRDGLEFHDGEPVTPRDVKFTFDYMTDWGVGYFAGFLDPLDEVELLEDETIRFHLEEPNATFLTNTLTQIVILPKHIWGDLVEPEEDHVWGEMMDDPSQSEGLSHPDEYENEEAIGSGPYELDYWNRGEEISLVRNENYFDHPDYYDADEIDVERISYIIYGHEEGVMGGLEHEEIDLVGDAYMSDYVDRVEEMEHVEYSGHTSIGFHYLSFDLSEPPFEDHAFREAAAHLIDAEELLDIVHGGYGEPGGAGRVISPSVEFWRNPDVPEYPFDPDRAVEILEDAGYEFYDGDLYYPED
ncbi:ABC transporter substrate-binding protein [Natranaerobius thermophilus]|uniref:Extracellular solute-binding protein family 5 n=1 Tax=Natranaerobius thermophilus (strain ATCC BAA-1301 / DSM 18059 / JW/NM-WN-LF) TaxID=457570 RepID=B2A0S3_NATTJ|nr:ABC transporter substrate-binding protein [Natranaerobius thermophilus]ACB85953.1 extracellular solute-binding protein family 5 [Natranaerobius thermophilus JW/NM-WN-LF]